MNDRIHIVHHAAVKRPEWSMEGVLARLRSSREQTHNIRPGGRAPELPSPIIVAEIANGLAAAMFPNHLRAAAFSTQDVDIFVGNHLETAIARLAEQLRIELTQHSPGIDVTYARIRARIIAEETAEQLPGIRNRLVTDFRAALNADPAFTSIADVLHTSRGARALVLHRIAHALHGAGGPLVARMIAGLAFRETGIDIHPGAVIGAGLVIHSGSGVVIADSVVIGAQVQLHPNVTLGSAASANCQPMIADGAVIAPGTVLQGP